MITLILLVLVGLVMAFFATQNISGTTITLANYTFRGIPLYIVVIGSVLLGIIISWLISLSDSLSSNLTLHRKESAIKDAHTIIDRLQKENRQLELENTQLKKKDEDISEQKDNSDNEGQQPSLIDRVRYSLK